MEFWPYLRDPETLARPWAIPGTPGLMHRVGRHREGGRHRQHLLRAGEPRAHGPPAGGQGRRHRQRHPAGRGARRRGRRAARRRLGLHVGGHRRRRCERLARRGTQGGVGPPRPPQPAAAQPGRHRAPLPPRRRARDEPRPALPARCGPSTWSTPSPITKVQGVPFTALELEQAYADVLAAADGSTHDRHRSSP